MLSANSIQDLIAALQDESTPFPPKLLYQFSDLTREDLQQLGKAWLQVSLQRRRNLLSDLVELAEKDDLLLFESLGQLALDDSDDEVVMRAIDLLFESPQRRLAPVFRALMKNQARKAELRAAAANALGAYVYLGEIDKLPLEDLRAVEEDLLASYRQDASSLVRRRALESLGYSSRPEVPALIRAAAAQDEDWLESALFAMGRSADQEWEEDVLENIDHENLIVQCQAIHAAGELGLGTARAYLVKLLGHARLDTDLKQEAIWALSQIGGEGVEELFEKIMARTDDEDELRTLEEAIDTLNFTNDASLYDLLEVDESSDQDHYLSTNFDDDEDEDDDYDPSQDPDWLIYVGELEDDDDEEELEGFYVIEDDLDLDENEPLRKSGIPDDDGEHD
jgi:hypothetical protein